MEDQTTARFAAANLQLRNFLKCAQEPVKGLETISEYDLQSILAQILILAPDVEHPSRQMSGKPYRDQEVVVYIKNLLMLRVTLQNLQQFLFSRRSQLDAASRHICALRIWIEAFQKTT
jgi:hypothetical protein